MPKNLTDQDRQQLADVIARELEREPTICVVGVSGSSKSSTINTLFKTALPVSHTVACTRRFEENEVTLRMTQGQAEGRVTRLIVYDAPGLGEDVRKDPEYLEMYRKHLPACDVVLWGMSARNRAVALDQQYLAQMKEFHAKMVFGLSQVDLVEPMNWKPGLPIPSKEQEANIAEIVEDRSKRISETLGRRVRLVPYSNYKGYNLEELFATLLTHVQGDRAWIFSGLKNFSYKDFMPRR
jgi:predicted GTPase